MRKITFITAFSAGILLSAVALAVADKEEAKPGPLAQNTILERFGFIDEDGDGINDLARDSDNDGIPNCLDPDWVRPLNGTGYKNQHAHQHKFTNKGSGGPYNYSFNYLWTNNWCNGNTPDFGNPSTPINSQHRNRRPKGKH